jgi:hypothetical protein
MTRNLICGQPHRIILEKNIIQHGVRRKKQAMSKSPTSRLNAPSWPTDQSHAIRVSHVFLWKYSHVFFAQILIVKRMATPLGLDSWQLWALHSKLRKTLSSESPKVCSRWVPLLYVAHLTPLCNGTGGNQCIVWRNFVDGRSIAFSLERTSKDNRWQVQRWVNSWIPSLYMQILWEMLHYKETLSF